MRESPTTTTEVDYLIPTLLFVHKTVEWLVGCPVTRFLGHHHLNCVVVVDGGGGGGSAGKMRALFVKYATEWRVAL